MADVIANVADGIATAGWVILVDIITNVADGIATEVCFILIWVLRC